MRAPEPALGAYHSVNGSAGVDQFAVWLGRDVVWGLDFVGGESWSNVGWPIFWLEHWSKWVKAKPGRRFVLSIPILAGPVDGSGPKQGDVGVGKTTLLQDYAQRYADRLAHHARLAPYNWFNFYDYWRKTP